MPRVRTDRNSNIHDTRDADKFDALLNLIRMVVVMVVLTTAVVVYHAGRHGVGGWSHRADDVFVRTS